MPIKINKFEGVTHTKGGTYIFAGGHQIKSLQKLRLGLIANIFKLIFFSIPSCFLSPVYHHYLPISVCDHVWRLWPWLDNVPICIVVSSEGKEAEKL